MSGPSYPGVYVEEIPSGVPPIEGVPTGIAAFFGETERGPTRPRGIAGVAEFDRVYGAASGNLRHAVAGFFENGGTRCFVCRIIDEDEATCASASVPLLGIRVRAIGEGAWGRGVRIEWGRGVRIEWDPNAADPDAFDVRVRYRDQTERFDGVVRDPESPRCVAVVLNANSNLVAAEPVPVVGDAVGPGAVVLDEGGGDGSGITLEDFVLRPSGVAAWEEPELDDAEILYAPNALEVPGLAQVLLRHCEARHDRFCILDALADDDSSAAQLRRRYGLESRHGALYMPWLEVRDADSGAVVHVPPGGHVAGIYARVDRTRGVWKAPANEVVKGAIGLRFVLTDDQQGPLNDGGVSVIRELPGKGIRVWGARTLSSDPEWKYVSVRRLFAFMEKSIERGTQWVVFEPNDESLWSRVRASIEQFLVSLWRDGALQGATPKEAFYVRCDSSTMTQTDMDEGRLIVEIGIAPLRPAEFVVLRIGQWTASSAR